MRAAFARVDFTVLWGTKRDASKRAHRTETRKDLGLARPQHYERLLSEKVYFNVLDGTSVAEFHHNAQKCTADPGKTPASSDDLE